MSSNEVPSTPTVDLYRALYEKRGELEAHERDAKERTASLNKSIYGLRMQIAAIEEGIDMEKVRLARTILSVRGSYERGGEDRASVISDAIAFLISGVSNPYKDMWTRYFGTKSYDSWHGQRTDCAYGMGPSHGSIIFAVEINREVRNSRRREDLTPAEVEASVYLLTNLQRVQTMEARAVAA